jgi:hypothetical protein
MCAVSVFVRCLLESCDCNIHGFIIYKVHRRMYVSGAFSFGHLFRWGTLLLLFFAGSLHDIVNAEEHAGRLKIKVLVHYGQRVNKISNFDRRLEYLDLNWLSERQQKFDRTATHLDAGALIQAIRFHIHDLARLAVHAPRVFSIRMFRSQLRQHSDRIPPAVLHERSGNDLHRVCDGSERPTLDTRHTSCFCVQPDADSHFGRTTAGCKDRVEVNITRDGEGVRKVAVYFVEDILRGSAKKNRTCFWVSASSQEGEVSGMECDEKSGTMFGGQETRTRLPFFRY